MKKRKANLIQTVCNKTRLKYDLNITESNTKLDIYQEIRKYVSLNCSLRSVSYVRVMTLLGFESFVR